MVTLLYTRGFEWFTVSTRREDVAGDPESVWSDPIAGEGTLQQYEPVVLEAGRFAATDAQRSLTAPFVPHLWGIGDGLVFTVAGNLSATDLVAVAEVDRLRRAAAGQPPMASTTSSAITR